jgi:hypothetical protein
LSDTTLMVAGVLEVLGLAGLFVWARTQARRRAAGKERPPRLVRFENGTPATAVITGIEETGSVYNRRPEVQVSVVGTLEPRQPHRPPSN